MPAAVARGFGGDLHGGEGAGIGGTPHLDGSGAGAADGEGAGGDQLGVAGPAARPGVPAFIEPAGSEVGEVVDGELDGPAAVGLAGDRLARGGLPG